MDIIVNGNLAKMKKGASFDFVVENRDFTDADAYSFSIIFPLAGCPENIRIFGHLHRADCDTSDRSFDCEIRGRSFEFFGTLIVLEISASEVKCQFLEGRSALNLYSSFDDIYINELTLGECSLERLPSDPSTLWQGIDYGQEYVALPWIDYSAGIRYNGVTYSNGRYSYDCSAVSFQPYLIFITKRIFDAIGYSYDLSVWESSCFKYLLVCNTLSSTVGSDFSNALPHWSISEFISELEQCLACDFDIDHKAKHISMQFVSQLVANAGCTCLSIVDDTFTMEQSQEDSTEYNGAIIYRYKSVDHPCWPFYDCPWYIDKINRALNNNDNTNVQRPNRPATTPTPVLPGYEFDSVGDLIAGLSYLKNYDTENTLYQKKVSESIYVRDIDTYFIFVISRTVPYDDGSLRGRISVFTHLISINAFGNSYVSPTEKYPPAEKELQIVPVPLASSLVADDKGNIISDFGRCMSLVFSGIDNSDMDGSSSQPTPYRHIQGGEAEHKDACYDTIFIAYWNGSWVGTYPCPIIEPTTIAEDWQFKTFPFPSLNPTRQKTVSVDLKRKYKFSFLSDKIPNIRSIFLICGKKYLCKKISATFSPNGMSKLLKGEFYRITD